LKAQGYEEGRNLVIERRWSYTVNDRLGPLAQDLVRRRVDVIVAFSNGAIDAARKATRTIPIVMVYGIAPIEAGFVRSLSQPGGNITGNAFHSTETATKAFDLLADAFPRAKRAAMLGFNVDRPGHGAYSTVLARLAKQRGMQFQSVGVAREEDLRDALLRVKAGSPDVLLVANDVAFDVDKVIAEFAINQKIPTVGMIPGWVDSGGLMYFGPDEDEPIERTPRYVVRLLQGAKASELPVEQPSIYHLAINARAARALGYSIPDALRLRADHVIE
jgi:putative ABC transport system substrate-binding protein